MLAILTAEEVLETLDSDITSWLIGDFIGGDASYGLSGSPNSSNKQMRSPMVPKSSAASRARCPLRPMKSYGQTLRLALSRSSRL